MQSNTSLVQAVYAAFGRGDAPFILSNLDEAVEWASNCNPADIPWGGVRHGHAGALSFLQALGGHVDFEAFEPRLFAAEGDLVFVQGRSVARVKATGRAYDSDWVHVFTISGGKLKRFHEFYDTAAIIAALPAK